MTTTAAPIDVPSTSQPRGGAEPPATDDPFLLDGYLRLPRVSGLTLSPDGARLVTQVQVQARDGKTFTSSLWEVDPHGQRPARRLTRSSAGESLAAFLPDGSLLFTSTRRDPDLEPPPADGEEPTGLWRLPADGGEAVPLLSAAGGIEKVVVADRAGTVALSLPTFKEASSLEEDAARGKARQELGVNARLFDSYPVTWWDHWQGPRYRRVWAAPPPAADGAGMELRDLTPDAGTDLPDDSEFALSADGATVVLGWARGRRRYIDLMAIDVAGGARRLLCRADEADFNLPVVAPDGGTVACVRTDWGNAERPFCARLWFVPIEGGEGRDALPEEVQLWPVELLFTPDGSALLFTADDHGEHPVFRLELGLPDAGAQAAARLTRLTASGAYTDVRISPDGRTLYALRSSLTAPPAVVAFSATGADQAPPALPSPGPIVSAPGRVERVRAKVGDIDVEGWLTLPEGASAGSPAPLLLFIHGGPLASFSGWSWRWNPQLLARRGYAVLSADPALSTGYGDGMIRRGWRQWGGTPYSDLMAILEATVQRPDIDAGRTAALGGSYGGYMANWIAGHTDRFRCIVTHASVWALDQSLGTTDFSPWFEAEMGDPHTPEGLANLMAHSPHLHVGNIHTPMLVIHGELDRRVHISEAMRLWNDLCKHEVPARFLYFPDENHWILKPPNIRLWYETVFAFLDEHLRDRPFEAPALLR
ncbi:MAG TPA: S9 family peptidase [Candidatus Dormibacteraeota bacterium]